MSQDLPYILPSAPAEVEDTFATSETTYQFYREVETRSEFERHCSWYHTTAQRHRQELEKMRGEFNFFELFRRR